MVKIAYGVCCGSWERLQRWVLPHAGYDSVTVMSGQTSIAHAYNAILAAHVGTELDALILQHDDLEITDPHATEKFVAALSEPDVGLVGVAGGRNVHGLDWWNAETVGHQWIDAGLLDFGPRTGDVQSLEGSILVLSPWAIVNIRFDPIPGFHGYDEISMRVIKRGRRVVVADVDTHHHTSLGFKSPESERDWHSANTRFKERWKM